MLQNSIFVDGACVVFIKLNIVALPLNLPALPHNSSIFSVFLLPILVGRVFSQLLQRRLLVFKRFWHAFLVITLKSRCWILFCQLHYFFFFLSYCLPFICVLVWSALVFFIKCQSNKQTIARWHWPAKEFHTNERMLWSWNCGNQFRGGIQ